MRPAPSANAAMVQHLLHQGYTLEEVPPPRPPPCCAARVHFGGVVAPSCRAQAAYYVSVSHGGAAGGGVDLSAQQKQRNLVPSRHLWIGGLVNATRADILDMFGPFGKIEHFKFIKVSCLRPRGCPRARTVCPCVPQGRRCAFVDFAHQQDAEAAFAGTQGKRLGGSYIDLGFGRPERASSARECPRLPPIPCMGTRVCARVRVCGVRALTSRTCWRRHDRVRGPGH